MKNRPWTCSLTCVDCRTEFRATRNDALRCIPCRKLAWKRQTKESAARNRLIRNERAKEAQRLKALQQREAVMRRAEKVAERFRTDPEYRERKRAYQRDFRDRGGIVRDWERRRTYAKEYYAKNKAKHNLKRVLLRKSQAFKKDACELCGNEDPRVLCVHHKTPIAKGGTNDVDNLQTLCANCHKIVHFEMGGG